MPACYLIIWVMCCLQLDDKLGVALNDTTVGYYVLRIVSVQDYALFGMGGWKAI